MTNQTVKAAQESVKKSEEFDIRYFPVFSFLGMFYIVAELICSFLFDVITVAECFQITYKFSLPLITPY